ncbi:PX-domain-containing protein [Panus rudis PR-1116 ss-1]|nr:PX-domain-containing protein [Panus rudis PR-1116 ss-1]
MPNSPTATSTPVSSLTAFLNALSLLSLNGRRTNEKTPEFDAGLNSSAAWTESLEEAAAASARNSTRISRSLGADGNLNSSLSDDEGGSQDGSGDEEGGVGGGVEEEGLAEVESRSARALYAFTGQPEFRELSSVQAGDELEVLKEEVGDGWSLVRHFSSSQDAKPEIGLLPRTYYIFTADFTPSSTLTLPASTNRRQASNSSITPRGSPTRLGQPHPLPSTLDPPPLPPLIPQNTGEWFTSIRRSILGGKSLNRFSSFVTSGAEEFVLTGGPDPSCLPLSPPSHTRASTHVRESTTSSISNDSSGVPEADRHFIDAGPSWRSKIPPFRVLVHSPSKRTSVLSGAYTVYAVTSLFDSPSSNSSSTSSHPSSSSSSEPPSSPTTPTTPTSTTSPIRITVYRRFTHFVVLHTALTRRLHGIALPPLPSKQYSGRFADDFVEARRGDLERYLERVVRHPVARYAEVLTFFLGCESDSEWRTQYPTYLSPPSLLPPSTFYTNVYHPAYNVDADEASSTLEKFVAHTKAVGRAVQEWRGVMGAVRGVGLEMSKAQRLLSYTLLGLITSNPLLPSSSSLDGRDGNEGRGLMNKSGAWCWREGCRECLHLTKGIQKTAEVLQSVADLYDDHARRTQLATHESLKSVAHPHSIYSGVIDTHKSTLSRYREAIRDGDGNGNAATATQETEDLAARCETVLNTTMAEMDTYHTQKVEDFEKLARELVDGEIELYEQVIVLVPYFPPPPPSPPYRLPDFEHETDVVGLR